MPSTSTSWLTDSLKSYFEPGVRKRGEQYDRANKVSSITRRGGLLTAKVSGTRGYTVELGCDPDNGEIGLDCTCPYYRDQDMPCKHQWAVLKKAERLGLIDQIMSEVENADAVEPWIDEAGEEDEDDGPWFDELNELDESEQRRDKAPVASRQGHSRLTGAGETVIEPADPSRGSRSAGSRSEPATGAVATADGRQWSDHLARLAHTMERHAEGRGGAGGPPRELAYLIDLEATGDAGALVVSLAQRLRQRNGQWAEAEERPITTDDLAKLGEADRKIVQLMSGEAGAMASMFGFMRSGPLMGAEQMLEPADEPLLLEMMARTGRCHRKSQEQAQSPQPLTWDAGEPWQLRLEVDSQPQGGGRQYQLRGALCRGGEQRNLSEPLLLTPAGIVMWEQSLGRYDDGGDFAWIKMLAEVGAITAPGKEAGDLVERLMSLPRCPPIDLPEELRFEQTTATPLPRLTLRQPEGHEARGAGGGRLRVDLAFDYGGPIVAMNDPREGVFDREQYRRLLRDAAAERAALDRVFELGARETYDHYQAAPVLSLARQHLSEMVRTLTHEGWWIQAEGAVYRQAGEIKIEVESGIDWFGVHGQAAFDDQTAPFPELLQALAKGEKTIRLGDGTYGLLPDEWLKRYAPLAQFGERENGHMRFGRNQVGLLDAMLAELPEANVDQQFQQARQQLQRFTGIQARKAPAGFKGTLRDYQKEGLGWLHFLRRFGFGGCLADDMGLGKTIQVLALLESRRTRRRKRDENGEPGRPSLVVAPRSLISNWRREAGQFTPQMRVLEHIGPQRWRDENGHKVEGCDHFADYDLLLTTYTTMRLDIEKLRQTTFDYAILDESQAIKNADTAAAKAARLLHADHRLALSGTPIENSLNELFSLFEFLNPGMLGRQTSAPRKLNGNGHGDNPAHRVIGSAVHPFLLRRTKQQVATELPERTEQTLYCDLEGKQRKQYDELREHYRQSLLGRVEQQGMNQSKMHVLEALLRLRQAACHPGLIDERKRSQSSAKIDALWPQLQEVIAEGNKALIFSQFTSLLRIVRDRLDKARINYQYLDGRTSKRSEKVDRFQNDSDCSVFLISLKAGGVGLNLTAAGYVFLLDPWWNPAVEAQAIDRTHRIGQHQQVFAYRLIARDTVEEKVLELQQHKREIADAIISADGNLIRDMSADDLRWLLS